MQKEGGEQNMRVNSLSLKKCSYVKDNINKN